MFKHLLVGDIHATPASLDECKRLFEFIAETCYSNNVKSVILMGDLLDTHAILHSTVINFYYKQFNDYSNLNFICLVGNHDHPLRNRHEHGLIAFKNLKNVTVVDDFRSFEDFDAMPYTDNDEFIQTLSKKTKNILLCHHEFLGSTYENGFYSSHGISLDGNPYNQIISGHIHKIQEFGAVKYVGAPRWLHASDANQDRGIWLWDGKSEFKFLDSANVVGKIVEIKINENTDLPQFNPNLYKQVILKVSGRPKFIQEISEKYLGKAEVLANITQDAESTVSEALGVNEALKKFILKQYKIQFSDLTNEALLKEVVDRLNECATR
jgi:DNA repair exonuclease SbcCD nuclease subunit